MDIDTTVLNDLEVDIEELKELEIEIEQIRVFPYFFSKKGGNFNGIECKRKSKNKLRI